MDYPRQYLGNRIEVYFGQSMSDIEGLVGKSAAPGKSPVARPSVDYEIEIPGVNLSFDTGRLQSMRFFQPYDFRIPINSYPESWRNLDRTDDHAIRSGMTKEEFMAYLRAWQAGASEAEATYSSSDDLLQDGEYEINDGRDREIVDMVSISLGPHRRTGRGGVWGDGCHIFFVIPESSAAFSQKVGQLQSISVSCDKFNTCAR